MAPHADDQNGPIAHFNERWITLVERVRLNQWDTLSPADRAFYVANLVRGCVMRGGLHAYFAQAPKRHVRLATEVFRSRGAPQVSALLEEAELLLFPEGLPDDFAAQCERLPSWTDRELELDIEPAWSTKLDALNQAFRPIAASVDKVVFGLAEET